MQFMNTKIDWPLDKNVIRRGLENHTFGMVRRALDGSPKPHQGWDFFASVGTPVYSVAAGSVIYAGNRGDFGNVIVISIGTIGVYAAYAHLSRIDIKPGMNVYLGQQIGLTGNTGNAVNMKGPDEHLHFELRIKPLPGLGLADRLSPFKIFQTVPYREPILRNKK